MPEDSAQFASSEALQSIAFKWFEAFNNHDLDRLLSLYDDRAVHFSPKLKARHPETKGLISGKQALQAWWRDAFDRIPSLHYRVTSLTAGSGRIFMEYVRSANGEEDMLIAEVLEVNQHLIIASRVYHG